jgi:hypothetical protein
MNSVQINVQTRISVLNSQAHETEEPHVFTKWGQIMIINAKDASYTKLQICLQNYS